MIPAAVILSGGQSSRMGQDKSKLKINNITLLEHAKSLLHNAGVTSIFVSGETGIKDKYINSGPLAGIHASLDYLARQDFLLFIPVDMPLLSKELILKLIRKQPETLFHYQRYNLPFYIKNSTTTRKKIKQLINANKLSIYQMFDFLHAESISNNFSDKLFINTNTPEQWQNFVTSLPK